MWYMRDKNRSSMFDMQIAVKEHKWRYAFVSLAISVSWIYVLVKNLNSYNKIQLLTSLIIIISSLILGMVRSYTLLHKRGISRLEAKIIANSTFFVVVGVFITVLIDILK